GPSVADPAAAPVTALQLRETVPTLLQIREEPDPRSPFRKNDSTTMQVHELVRVNHLGNCVMCHAPSFTRDDPVRGAVPTPGQPLPAPVTTPQYYEMGGTFVRADVTYLQQDFSVFQPVAQPNNWPDNQRYDYLVRTRPSQTADAKLKANDNKPSEYQQAVLFSLRELTGVEGPQSVQDWKQALPHPDKLVKLQGGFRQ